MKLDLFCIEELYIVFESNEVVVVVIYVILIYLFYYFGFFVVMYIVILLFVIDINVFVVLYCFCGVVLYIMMMFLM